MPELTATDRPLLILRGIHKHFPGVHAVRGIDMDVRRGEVHAVVGENGAGKSTLMQILAGVYQADSGHITFDNQANVVILDERFAQKLGIALVYQERSLFGPLSVAENIFAARQPITRWDRIDRRALIARTRCLLEEVGLDVDPDAPVESLSSAQQQLVEVAKALSLEPKLILFDEPTAALVPAETDRLFKVIRRLRARQVGVIYISHRLEEVFAIADRVTVLKDGAGRGTFAARELTVGNLVALMVGREVNPHSPHNDRPPEAARIVLEVSGLNDPADQPRRRPHLQDLRFSLRVGEIVGLAGLVGAGRTELALALFGNAVKGFLWVVGLSVKAGK
jgi:ABC-type sugar transport system ATPase subunit